MDNRPVAKKRNWNSIGLGSFLVPLYLAVAVIAFLSPTTFIFLLPILVGALVGSWLKARYKLGLFFGTLGAVVSMMLIVPLWGSVNLMSPPRDLAERLMFGQIGHLLFAIPPMFLAFYFIGDNSVKSWFVRILVLLVLLGLYVPLAALSFTFFFILLGGR